MKLFAVPVAAILAVAMLVLAGFNLVQAQPNPPSNPPTNPPEVTFPGLEGIPRDQLFSHFMGAQFNVTDKNGNQVTIKMTPGTVSSVTDNTSITITPNGQTNTQTFGITANTKIRAMPSSGSVQALNTGDQVIIVTEGTSTDAIMIHKHNPSGMGGFHHGMF